jgi:folate-binding protein YgfZ
MIRPDYGLIHVRGDDAMDFLQGQLTNDVRELAPNHALQAAYCTPQGRVLALLTLLPTDDGALMLLPRELVASVIQRLQMFVMRARVSLESVDCDNRLLSGNQLPAQAAERDEVVASEYGMAWVSSTRPALCWLLLDDASRGPDFSPHDDNQARLWHIEAGLPEITESTSGQYIPQMLNLDVLGAVSFRKGCYTGQEIVARTQHLGRIKRRLFRIAGPGLAPAPGSSVERSGQAAGQILSSADQGAGFTALAVLQLEAATGSTPLEVAGRDVQLLPLPYIVADASAAQTPKPS